jgi:hypothetical protein
MPNKVFPICVPSALSAELPSAHGFADGGEAGVHLFLVNPAANPCAANEFAANTRAALNKLLNSAILGGGMDGDTTQLVQYLIGAIDAAAGHAASA